MLKRIEVSKPDFEKLYEEISYLENINNNYDSTITTSILDELLEFQSKEDGSFNLLSSFDVEKDARCEFGLYPTYIITAILIQNIMKTKYRYDETISALNKSFIVCSWRDLRGACHEDHVKNIKTFIRCDILKFIYEYKNEFNKRNFSLFRNTIFRALSYYSDYYLASGREDTKEIALYANPKYRVFVYGTLMKGESNSNYLHKPVNRKRAILSGYKMYQVSPSFPGIVKSNNKNTYIYGECMYVTLKDILKLDCLESNGYLYKRELVKVTIDNKECDAIVYVYNRSVKNMEEIKYFIKEENKENYRWYVCYGSNLLKRRFMCYIKGISDEEYKVKAPSKKCNNTSEPLCSLRVQIPYELYYGKSSSSWNNGGVAFLDPHKKGNTMGRAYLITKEQYEHVHNEEGKTWYGYEIVLGEIDGIKVVTFTNEKRQMENAPSDAYKKVINAGTKETMELEYCEINN